MACILPILEAQHTPAAFPHLAVLAKTFARIWLDSRDGIWAGGWTGDVNVNLERYCSGEAKESGKCDYERCVHC